MYAKQAVLVILLTALVVSVAACGTPQANKACSSGYMYYGRCLSLEEARAANLAVQQPTAPAVQSVAQPTAPAVQSVAQPTAPAVQSVAQPTAPAVQSVAQPTANPAQLPSGGVPYNLPPQPQIGHPSLYLETGVPDPVSGTSAKTKRWVIDVLQGTFAIVGGFTVDGTSNGVYKAVAGPVRLDTTVTDGFLAITKSEWANTEFCFRIGQAVQYGWAHNTVTPISGWTACNTTQTGNPAPQAPASVRVRVTTGDRQSLRFNQGDSVVGWKIVLDNGKSCDGGNCYVENALSGGTVTSGVVNPWDSEVPAASFRKDP